MKRKINRVGQNTLTVSLPTKWAKKQNLNAGDEVEVEPEGKNLVIGGKTSAHKIKKAKLNIDDFSKIMINRYLAVLYREGVEEIEINFTKEKIPDYKDKTELRVIDHINKVLKRFIGTEIVSQTKNRIILQNLISKEKFEKIEVVEKRVYFLIKEFLEEFILAMDGDFKEFHKRSYDYHNTIAKFTYYYLRLLNFSEFSEEKKTALFGLYMVIDKMIDKVRHTSERVNEMKNITPKIKKYVKAIFDQFLIQFDMLFKKDFQNSDIHKIIKARYELLYKLHLEKLTAEEEKVVSECKIIGFDTINDFTETYVALNKEKYVELW